MAEDKKGLLVALLSKKKPQEPKKADVTEAEHSFNKWTSCGSDLLSAIESKDAKRIGMVLQAASDLGGEEDKSSEEEKDESDEY